MDRIRNLTIFVRVVEAGSFSKCAEDFGVGQPTISKAIESLEEELAVKLLIRTTRSLTLTEEGKKILGEAKKVIESYEGLIATAGQRNEIKGSIRVTAPNAFSSLYLLPAIRSFMDQHPQISIKLIATDSFLDLSDNDIDVAIRFGELENSSYVAKKIGDLHRVAMASEIYLQGKPMPKTLEDLKRHRCITVGRSGLPATWSAENPKGVLSAVDVSGDISVDNHLALLAAVRAGLGIGLAVKFIFNDEDPLHRGLVQVLRKYTFKSMPLHILFRENKNLPARVRVFVDYFFKDLKKQKWVS